MRYLFLIALVGAVFFSPVRAQVVETMVAPLDRQEVGMAVFYSAAATLVPMATGSAMYFTSSDPSMQGLGLGIAAAGMVLGPSVGTLYLRDGRRAWIGVALRGAGATAFGVGFGWGFIAGTSDDFGVALSSGLISLSAILLPYGFAFNFLTMDESARDFAMSVTPTIDRESGALMPSLVVRF